MTREELYRAVGEVREDQIADAAEKPNRTAPRWRRYGALAACLAVVLGVAAGSWIWYLLPAGSSADPFEYRYDHGWEEEEDASGAVTIPTYPFGEGAVLEVETDQSPRRESRPM